MPARRVYAHITVYEEEVGHGGAGSVPSGVSRRRSSVDMGCVGRQAFLHRQVSICVRLSGGPYSYEVVGKLIDAAKQEGASYALDVCIHYGSDVEATLGAGSRHPHGLIGPGVYASHGYERSHVDGVEKYPAGAERLSGGVIFWQHPASLVVSTPRFLSAKKARGVEPPRKKLPRNPFQRGSLWVFPKQRDRGPSLAPGLPTRTCDQSRQCCNTF